MKLMDLDVIMHCVSITRMIYSVEETRKMKKRGWYNLYEIRKPGITVTKRKQTRQQWWRCTRSSRDCRYCKCKKCDEPKKGIEWEFCGRSKRMMKPWERRGHRGCRFKKWLIGDGVSKERTNRRELPNEEWWTDDISSNLPLREDCQITFYKRFDKSKMIFERSIRAWSAGGSLERRGCILV